MEISATIDQDNFCCDQEMIVTDYIGYTEYDRETILKDVTEGEKRKCNLCGKEIIIWY